MAYLALGSQADYEPHFPPDGYHNLSDPDSLDVALPLVRVGGQADKALGIRLLLMLYNHMRVLLAVWDITVTHRMIMAAHLFSTRSFLSLKSFQSLE
jgi:hypothetical protein